MFPEIGISFQQQTPLESVQQRTSTWASQSECVWMGLKFHPQRGKKSEDVTGSIIQTEGAEEESENRERHAETIMKKNWTQFYFFYLLVYVSRHHKCHSMHIEVKGQL